MTTQKTITRYIPEGMNLAPPKSLLNKSSPNAVNSKKKKGQTRQELKQEDGPEEESCTVNRQQFTRNWINELSTATESTALNNTMETNRLPPKSICKNRSKVCEDSEIFSIKNSSFTVDRAGLSSALEQYESKLASQRLLPSSANGIDNKPPKSSHNERKMSEYGDDARKVCSRLNTVNAKSDLLPTLESWWKTNTTFHQAEGEVTRKNHLLKTGPTIEPNKITKILTAEMILHGIVIPKPVHTLQETYFEENVLKSLEAMDFTSATTVQSYMWPTVLRGLNVVMVGPTKCGKTLSYIPAICTFAMDIPQKYATLNTYPGPLILIVCTDEAKCKAIYCVINSLIKDSPIRVEMMTNMSSVDDCDIVVAVLSDLEKCLRSEMVTLKRLCHLVLEDADLLLKNHPFMKNLLNILNDMQQNRPRNKSIQVIATTEKWTADLDNLMERLHTTPVVCFQDFLQAAFYSNISFKKKKLNPAHKRFHLEDILKQRYSLNKSVVFCNEDEISEISEYLEMKGIECICISDNLLDDEIVENEDMWCSLTVGRFKVLLCTDELFKKLNRVTMANWLIHYSAPKDWTLFQRRFKSLGDNMTSPLNRGDKDAPLVNHCSYMLVTDKKCIDGNIFNEFFNQLITSQICHLKL